MSLRTLLIWCIIAGFLGGGAVFVKNQQTKASQNKEVEWARLEFDPASIVQIQFGIPDQEVQIERHPDQIDEWVATWSTDTGDRSWGISSSRIRGALRTLSTTSVRMSDQPLTDTSTGLVLTSRDGSTLRLNTGSDRAGGRTPIMLEQRDESGAINRVLHGWIESGIAEAFSFSNSLSWRETKLVSIPLSSVDRVSVQAGSYSTQIQQTNGRWQLAYPFTTDADRTRVDELIGTVLGLKAQRFVDDPIDDDTTGLANPIATIKLNAGDEKFEFIIGQRADVGGDSLYAKFSTSGSSTLIHISTEALTKLTAVPDAYVSTTAGSFSLTDVRSMHVLNKDLQPRLQPVRDGSTWSVQDEQIDTLNENAINRLLSLLTQTPANAVRVLNPEQELPKPIAGIQVFDSLDQTLSSYDAAIEQSDQGIRLLIMQTLETGHHIVWAYVGEDAQASATWLTLTAGRSNP